MSKSYLLLTLMMSVFLADQAFSQLFFRMRSNYRYAPQPGYGYQNGAAYGYGYGNNGYGYVPKTRNCPYGNGYAQQYQQPSYQAYRNAETGGMTMQTVTVYDPRTGLRTVRMVPVPQMVVGKESGAEQSSAPNSSGPLQTASPNRLANQTDLAKVAAADGATDATPANARSLLGDDSGASSVLADSDVQPAGFDGNASSNAKASQIGAENRKAGNEFSVLDVGESPASNADGVTREPASVIEILPPEN